MTKIFTFFAFTFLLFSYSSFSQVQIGDDIEGEGEDSFGQSISISGNGEYVAIGAPLYDISPPSSSDHGQTKVYGWNETTNIWNQVGNDINGSSGDLSGSSVSLSSNGLIAAIGAPRNDDNGSNSGSVKILELFYGAWIQIGNDIDGENAGDESGSSVSISANGNTVAIGAPKNDDNGGTSGHTRIYKWNGVNWNQLGNDINGENASDASGTSVSLSNDGNIVAIGAPTNDGNGNNSGHTRIYEWNGTSWNQKGSDIDGEALTDNSGRSVSLAGNGNTVAIGAPNNDGNGSNSGHTRIYEWNGTSWAQKGSDIDGLEISGYSGTSVSMSATGDTIAIGANQEFSNAGSTRIFIWNGSSWDQIGDNIVGEPNSKSGTSVSITTDGSMEAIGSPDLAPQEMVRVYRQDRHHTFTGAVSEDWSNPANWDKGTLPTQIDDVFITNNPGIYVPNGFTAECNSLHMENLFTSMTINNTATLNVVDSMNIVVGELFIDGTLNINSFYIGQIANVEIHGGINFSENNFTWFTVEGSLDNYIDIPSNDSGQLLEVLSGGSFNNFGLIEHSNFIGASILNSGTITNKSTGEIKLQGDPLIFTFNGQTFNTGKWITNESTGIFTNEGIISMLSIGSNDADHGIRNENVFNNKPSGVISIKDVESSPLLITSAGTFTNEGSLTIEKSSGSGIMISTATNGTFTNTSTATLAGEGDILGTFNFEGNISPGNSPGKITYSGALDLVDGKYICEIEGTSGAGVTNGNDLIEITDLSDVGDGELEVNLLNGFSPSLGNQFTILTGNSISGIFNATLPPLSVGLIWDIIYSANSVVLEVKSSLPIELSDFDILEKENLHLLNWTTQSESNASHFEIEYSLDGTIWKNIGTKQAVGESNTLQNYSFENSWNRNVDLHYYRLKMVDLDETFEYSNIKSIESKIENLISIFPNPFSQNVKIKVPSNQFEISNMLGEVIFKSEFSAQEFDFSNFSNGVYFVKYFHNGKLFSKKIIKSN